MWTRMVSSLVLLFCAPLGAQKVLLEQRTPDSYQTALLVPQERFGRSELKHLADRFLEQHRQPKLAKLLVVTNKEGASTLGFPTSDRGFVSWVISYFAPKWQSWGMAEVLRIRKDAVLRIRYPEGRLDRVILRGDDPLRLSREREQVEVLYVDFPKGDEDDRHRIPAVFFVQTSLDLSQPTCERIVRDLRESTGLDRGSVTIRNDPWFITSSNMPVQYRFWEQWPIPGPVEFIETQTALTGWSPEKPERKCFIMYPTRPPNYCKDVMYQPKK